MLTDIHISPEFERFANFCVENGRFDSVNAVIRSALEMFQEREERRMRFNAMLDDVRREADQEGSFAAADVLAEMDKILDQQTQ
ncbi:type II toxin-antitoxin system ParD family antitoxin [Candidatus Magnetaquicoccus inordinatus]|uniref:type II toxin-antitoxin system ParD family antitoxin n=1 Tax=Candidatus Magnetaquicoccus inordinatus TaxID=2496818 RepID=UPI00102BED36|nr:type II toxin-antitoxin system ParD family antitoxin [Candidatus Magnetaquicoccus inordinatus]